MADRTSQSSTLQGDTEYVKKHPDWGNINDYYLNYGYCLPRYSQMCFHKSSRGTTPSNVYHLLMNSGKRGFASRYEDDKDILATIPTTPADTDTNIVWTVVKNSNRSPSRSRSKARILILEGACLPNRVLHTDRQS